ncbi:MAG: hypothetical protein BGP22_16555 [Variovorax sp. 67-131]|uniref:filamentous haemagglutinin family protein n=1 Tax=Variovorax sp. SCN 67-85 TaxID=1660152 RepID=UPI00086E9194|nr:filamentous haemagglutinin family protein [Variovorax sp. SCN 67-85]MBN8755611.1 filamentous hemagglutinin family protein [Variovorax sp.]ODU19170.1 MAG: hypothetical protein ABS94_01455 [Variovorax sp. SCN 67-85]ODV23397.1 MAG: hypothetical protein ABT25_19025 [Variovorax sp. SCN 67-20]OJZ16030.1 MAG: hypothetical protein BGP22_16555 [Variovorax sp. 67-131]
MTLAAGGVIGHAQAQRAFSPGWFADKGAAQNMAVQTGRLPNGMPASSLVGPQAQQQQASAQLRRSLENLNLVAQSIAAQQASQAAARLAAQGDPSVPDGLAEGGLKIDTDSLTAGWHNANAPVQSRQADGRTNVAIQQTNDKAILNWETFNVGRNTTVEFKQQADWAVLNRVNDPSARPSRIQGQIKADGTVLVANRNGILFTGTSQVDTRNLVAAAAAITDDQFRNRGIYAGDTTPSFSDALGKVEVSAGAQIATRAPVSATQGGGHVFLLGSEVRNAGRIDTPSGQTVLAAGDSFMIRKGVGTDANPGSTTAGSEVAASRRAGSASSTVVNTGLIMAPTGDITLTGHSVTQAGVVIATTSTARRGTIHLSTRASDEGGTVALAQGGTTAIVLDAGGGTALDSQRDAALQRMGNAPGNNAAGAFDNLGIIADRRDLSRIEIVSGSTVEFQDASTTLATGGEIAVSAPRRTLVASGARLDVSGAVGVKVAMEGNNVLVNTQGNEQRDAPVNRDTGNLNNLNLWVDRRRLVLVPAGTGGYATDRWYTQGGLLEVSGYLATSGHTVGEWMAQGGTITVAGGDLVTRSGSSINLSGGTLDVATGIIRQSWLKGSDGQLHEVSRAPADLMYTGLYRGFEDAHARWGKNTTGYYYNPLIGPQSRLENGYTVGRDAGKLVVATTSAVLEGSIAGDTYQGPQQTAAARTELDGYNQPQNSAPRNGQLVVGQYLPIYDAEARLLRHGLTPLIDRVALGELTQGAADGLQLSDPMAAERQGTLVLDARGLSASNLAAVRIAARKDIAVRDVLQVADGGEIVLLAPAVDLSANLVAHSGAIRVGNVLRQPQAGTGNPVADVRIDVPQGTEGGVRVHEGVVLDASGRIGDLRLQGSDPGSLAHIDGGIVSLRSTESVMLAGGSRIDVSSGAMVRADGSIVAGKGGSVQLGSGLASAGGGNPAAILTLDGNIRGHGVNGGGTLDIESASGIVIGGKAVARDGVLAAGETSLVDLILKEDYQVKAGDVLPVDYTADSFHAAAGTRLPGSSLSPSVWYTLADDWVLPIPSAVYANSVVADDGRSWTAYSSTQPGSIVVPKGTTVRILDRGRDYFAGYVVEKNVFPDGMELRTPIKVTTPAGQRAPADFTLAAGTSLEAGRLLTRSVRVGGTTSLSTDLFAAGFSDYRIRGQLGVAVPGGVSLDVTMPVLRADATASAFEPWLPALYQENAAKATASQRRGASLSLAGGIADAQAKPGDGGSLVIGEGAQLRVDPGQSISLSSRGSMTVQGTLEAKGGAISLLGPQTLADANKPNETSVLGDGHANARAIVIGEHAVLDVSAARFVATDVLARPYGMLTDGGSIVVGGTLREPLGQVSASDAFVVVREGALLDASGSSASLYLPGVGNRTLASDGGSIQLASASGVYLDGTARARAGGAGVSGGRLVMALEAPSYAAGADDAVLAVRDLLLTQHRVVAPAARTAPRYGYAALAADQVRDGGFSSLGLYSNGMLSFGDHVDLSLERELRVYAGGIGIGQGVDPAISAKLAAPYVLLSGLTPATVPEGSVRPSFRGGVTTLASNAVLTMQGRQVDIKGDVSLGLNARAVGTSIYAPEQRAGFGQLNLISEGDLRFLAGPVTAGTASATTLNSTGSILLRAGQVYPATGVIATIRAGRMPDADTYDPEQRLVVERFDPRAAAPALPHSVFGRLGLFSAHVEQGGIVRAPLGEIRLGDAGPAIVQTQSLHLTPGSITSTSAAGLVMPYGGTSDGVNYLAADQLVTPVTAGLIGGIVMAGKNTDVAQGAVLDLSGGGDLRGAGFVSGRGGSSDARTTPLMQVGKDGFTLPGLGTNPVYAIVPGYASGYAPAGAGGALAPRTGQQITIGANDVPGLAAGTYTLLPSSYALLPGAFRVELNGSAATQQSDRAIAMRNGSFVVSGTLGVADTGMSDRMPRQVILTSADVLRHYSQYNETSYADFVKQRALLNGTVRGMLPADAKTLTLQAATSAGSSFRFNGSADFAPAGDGYGGTAEIWAIGSNGKNLMEILADGAQPTAGFQGASLHARDLNSLGAARLVIGGNMAAGRDTQSSLIDIESRAGSVTLRQGAMLRAPEVFLAAASNVDGITVELGAGINTIGTGRVAFDSTAGYVYRPGAIAVVAVSNGLVDMLAPAAVAGGGIGGGTIRVGTCTGPCDGAPARLYGEGTLAVATRGDFQMGDDARYGARNLVLAMGAVNAGSSEALSAARTRGALTPGLTLNQQVLDRLLNGDTSSGAPALERMALTAAESVNFFGGVSLNTIDPATGHSSLASLVLSTPALYGYGNAQDVASIVTGKLTWVGIGDPLVAPVAFGRGTGAGQLRIKADVIEFGHGPRAQPDNIGDPGRTILGFADVRMDAVDRITANHQGSLAVYQSQVAGADGPAYQGGNLTLSAPLVTGQGGSINRITAGGALQVLAPAGTGPTAAPKDLQTGAELDLSGASVRIDTTVALPSGRLVVKADGDVVLGDNSRLDLAGRELAMLDISRYSWGGDVLLQSTRGNIVQAAGSAIDVSARNNDAGSLSVVALDAGAGRIDLGGRLLGSATGHHDAGGTLLPYRAGGLLLRAQDLGDGGLSEEFAALNRRLNEGGFFGERNFQFKRGDLNIGDELRARSLAVSLDNGRLTVSGRVDASGEQVGSIRLSAANGLTIAGGATLDAHGTVLRVDSRGQIIDSPNRAAVVLDSGTGTLTIGDGARIDLRHGTASGGGDGAARGTLELHVARIGHTGSVLDADAATHGDMAIDARGRIDVQGARSIAVYGRQVYTDAPLGSDPAASGRPYQVVDQAYLDAKHAESAAFVDNALANGQLLGVKLAGLNNAAYREAFHLRPEVQITSATPDGDIVVRGDLDLSGQRYASLNPNTPRTGIYGSGEVGLLTLRAGGDLSIHGSINDGFAPPPETPDDHGWLLIPGVQAYGVDLVVPVGGVTLAEGTVYPKGKALNYDISAKDVTLPAGTLLPAAVTLDRGLTLPAGTVLGADVRAADGTVLLAAGTLVGAGGLSLPAGARLLAGVRLPVELPVARLIWPKGAALPVAMTQAGSLVLPVGALIASGTDVKLSDGKTYVDLRPVDAAGRQGRNWAVAQMLPEGSQSWSMRLVAGADLDAADVRLHNASGTGRLSLADTHFGAQVLPGQVILGLNSGGVDAIVEAAGGLPAGISSKRQMVGMLEAEVLRLYQASWPDFGLPMDFWTPEAGNLLMGLTRQGVDAVVAMAGGLPAGVSRPEQMIGMTEADLTRLYQADWGDFGMPSNFWALSQGNGSVINSPASARVRSQGFSVVRTGTGDLSLAAGGDFTMQSAYGVYTAGTATSLGSAALDARYNQPRGAINGGTVLGSVAGAQASDYERLVSGPGSLYKAWYPDRGGHLTVDVGGNLTGDSWSASGEIQRGSSNIGNWLWRQGTGDTAGVNGVPTAWWTNFGTYAYGEAIDGNGQALYWPAVVGFTGLGTLGGGDARISVGGDAGIVDMRTTGALVRNSASSTTARSQGLVLAVGSSGRVLDDGSIRLTGGGDLDLRIGGGWNGHAESRLAAVGATVAQSHELFGAIANLRGAIDVAAGRIGTMELFYASGQDAKDTRASNPYLASISRATGGLLLMPGDAGTSLSSRADMVLGGTGNPGLVPLPNGTPFASASGGGQNGVSWFSLWTGRTALQLMTAGGQLAFDTRASEAIVDRNFASWDYASNGGWYLLPGSVRATAATGSIFYGSSLANLILPSPTSSSAAGLLLAPQGERRIELVAAQSLYGGGYPISVSGADAWGMATPERPGFAGFSAKGEIVLGNAGAKAPQVDVGRLPLLVFGANTLSGNLAETGAALAPSRFYAASGDIVGLRTGTTAVHQGGLRMGETDYVAAGPVAVKAGRDIVGFGSLLGDPAVTTPEFSSDGGSSALLSGNLIVNTHGNDVSVIQAGRDILHANVDVAGPGVLEVSAGRNIIQNDRAMLRSIGPAVAADARAGAGIVVQAGMGSRLPPDYGDFLRRYLDPANQAAAGAPLAEQPGKVAKTYGTELVVWLKARFGFDGSPGEAEKFFFALAPEQQRIFARQILFAELRAGGREYNAVDGPRIGSYLRGRNAIATMFPAGEGGEPGDLLMYGGSGIHTDIGGDIQVLTPRGAQTYGIEGSAPPSTAGLITRGKGDVQLFSLGSILLGQSRVMTTFGGDILAWSAQGDINAGRGSKTTVVYTPPRQVYDNVGNMKISPDVPSTGAGIATLNPLPEVPPGDVDLIAPLGTIDAGEAGIRVSGNVNVAALHVVNADNIQVQGKSTGLPVTAVVNVGALANASAAASSAAAAAQDVLQRDRAAARQNLPSVFTVRVLGFGNESEETDRSPASLRSGLQPPRGVPYDPANPVQILGVGQDFDAKQLARLTAEQRSQLRQSR